MDNYIELVKRLREQVKCNKKLYPQGATFETLLLDLAADAIEEIATNYDAATDIMKRQTEYIEELEANKPRWIPVTERLPEPYKEVLCYYEYFRFGEYNCMCRRMGVGYFGTIDRHGEQVWSGEPGNGRKARVLYWMPLPPAPKEEWA